MDSYDLLIHATQRAKQRDISISDAMTGLPKRRSAELTRVCRLVDIANKVLHDCDLMPETTPLAAAVETMFEVALERIAEIKTELVAAAAAG